MESRRRPHVVATHLRAWLDTDPHAAGAQSADVDLLAHKLGLGVATFAPASQPEGTLGFLEPGEDLIFLRQGLRTATRRFTLAHEIGHAVLHRATGSAAAQVRTLLGEAYTQVEVGTPYCVESDLDTPLDLVSVEEEQLAPGQAYSARSRREAEANAFAAALLLPAEALLQTYAQPSSSGGRTARALARRFGVSEDVVLRRLAALLLATEEVGPAADVSPVVACSPQLDPLQRAAATAEAPALIVAGPGTGKTSTLVGRVAHLVGERGVAPAAILALTFSNKAAREMRERVVALLGAPDIASATPGQPTVSTIHAFCGELLREYAPRVGLRPDYRLITQAEGYFLLRGVCARLPLEYYQPIAAPAQYLPELLSAFSRAKDELATPEEYTRAAQTMASSATTDAEREAAARAREVALVYAAYQSALEARGDPDFGDVVRLAVRLLREHADVRERVRAQYAHFLVDEFQDINRAMGMLLRELAGSDGPLWAVGDADQAIYRFRGASPANLSRFTDDYPSGQIRRLERNYRSVAPILVGAAAFAGALLGNGERQPLEATRALGAEPAITLATAPDDRAELAGLVDDVRRRLDGGRAPEDVAVLCRTRRLAQQVAAALRAAGVPVRMMAPLLEQEEIKDLLAIPSVLAEPAGGGWLRAGRLAAHHFSRADAQALLRAARERGLSPVRLLAEEGARVAGVTPVGARGLARLATVLAELRSAPDVSTGLGRYCFSSTGLARDLLAAGARGDVAARERAMQIGRLLALARAYDDQRKGSSDDLANAHGADWSGFLDYLRVLVVLRQGEVGGDTVLAAGAPGVAVLTVHASKGLEFPVVLLPGLADRRFPTRVRWEAAPLAVGLSLDDDAERSEAGQLVEEACLFYVALTRARDAVVLSTADRYGKLKYAPSPFLAPIREHVRAHIAYVQWPAVATGVPATESAGSREPGRDATSPVQIAEIETYIRCPRQYAYRHVYGLRGQEAGLAALRDGVRACIRELRDRAAQARASAMSGQPVPRLSSLSEAFELLERQWQAAAGGEGMVRDELAGQALRRHGQRLVEREWRALAGEYSAGGAPGGALSDVVLDLPVVVRAGGRDIQFALDRVERPASALLAAPGPRSNGAGQPSVPARFVRQHLGGAANRADVRALLYTLAADQHAREGYPAEPVQQSAAGAEERIALSRRQEERVREDLAKALQGMEDGSYPARPDAHTCAGCPFLLICPA